MTIDGQQMMRNGNVVCWNIAQKILTVRMMSKKTNQRAEMRANLDALLRCFNIGVNSTLLLNTLQSKRLALWKWSSHLQKKSKGEQQDLRSKADRVCTCLQMVQKQISASRRALSHSRQPLITKADTADNESSSRQTTCETGNNGSTHQLLPFSTPSTLYSEFLANIASRLHSRVRCQ